MIGESFRRAFWLIASLIFVTLISFGVLSAAIAPAQGQDDLPIFLNPTPGRVERLATQLVSQLVSGNQADNSEGVAQAASQLAELGGAALPSVLPLLDSLTPEGRAQVAIALAPVRRRMGFESRAVPDVNRAILFWGRFWEEHAIDYRPVVAERAVSRLALRSTPLRQAEVRRLDTYALDALQKAVREESSADNISRLSRLTHQAALIAGRPELAVSAKAGRDTAVAKIAQWEQWWARNRSRYKTYRGSERITAMLRDTRYGEWVTQLIGGRLGTLRSGQPVGQALKDGLWVTLPLALFGLLGVWLARSLPWFFCGFSLGGKQLFGPTSRVFMTSIPVVVLLVVFERVNWVPGNNVWVGGGFVFLAGSFGVLRAVRPSVEPRQAVWFCRTLLALGIRSELAEYTAGGTGSPVGDLHWGADASRLVTVVFVVESVLGLSGLGTRTLEAFRYRELNWLMAVTMATACCIGAIQLLRDAVRSESLQRFRSDDNLSDWSK